MAAASATLHGLGNLNVTIDTIILILLRHDA
jgi:hypothetical protein